MTLVQTQGEKCGYDDVLNDDDVDDDDDGNYGDGVVGVDIQDFDQLLDYLGTGRWTLFYFTVVTTYFGCAAIPSLSGAFIAPLMNYTCVESVDHYTTASVTTLDHYNTAPDAILDHYTTASDTTLDHYTTASVTTLAPQLHFTTTSSPFITNITTVLDQCERWSEDTGRREKCTDWEFDHSIFGDTLTSEMLMVCDRSLFVPLYQSLYMCGCGIGAAVGGIISDRVGRRPVFVYGGVVFILLTSAAAFLPNIILVLSFRFILGVIQMASFQAGFTLVMETTKRSVRPLTGMMVVLGWAVAMIVYGGMGYAIRQWRYLQLATSLPFLTLVPALWFLHESPRWQLVRGDVGAAYVEVSRASRWHKVTTPPLHILTSISKDFQRQNVKDSGVGVHKTNSVINWLQKQILDLLILFRTRKLCLLTLIVCLDLFTSSLVYYSLSLSAVNLSADPFVYMSLSGLVEIPCYILSGPILARLGRKKPAVFCFLVTGIAMMALPLIPLENGWVRVTVAQIGKLGISMVFAEMYIYASELFPTEVRLQGLGTGLFFSRLGSLSSPFINDMLVPVYPWMTSVVYGGLSVAAGLATSILPETKDLNMPDVTADLDNRDSIIMTGATSADKKQDMEIVPGQDTNINV